MATSLKPTLCLLSLFMFIACTGSVKGPASASPGLPPTQVQTIKPPSTATTVPSPTQGQVADEEKVLTIQYWQAPTVPTPYLSSGTKDRDAGAVTLEPLAKYSPDGNLLPALAAEIPTIANGGFSDTQDLMSITWKLKDGLKWSDGSDMTADDVVFTSRYCMDEETGCTAHSAFDGISSIDAWMTSPSKSPLIHSPHTHTTLS